MLKSPSDSTAGRSNSLTTYTEASRIHYVHLRGRIRMGSIEMLILAGWKQGYRLRLLNCMSTVRC